MAAKAKTLRKGVFITFEGFEGSGKSTQIKLLADFLSQDKYPVVVLREPGSTKIGEKLRRILLDKNNVSISQKAELMLYLAARAQIVEEKIMPALKEGKIILCDRFQDATVAYQGFGLGMDREIISLFGNFVTCKIKPDLTILLDIPVKEGLKRLGENKDRIEERSIAYHKRVRDGYLKMAKEEPERIKLFSSKDIGITHEEIRKAVKDFLCHLVT